MSTYPNGQHMYSQEEDDWLVANIDNYTYLELTKKFNELFGTSIKSVADHTLKSLHIHKSFNTGCCKKGERRCKTTLPIGSESYDDAYVYVKVANGVNDCKHRRHPSKHNDPNWMRKDYLIWSEHGHKLPSDSSEMLIHLNTDPKDCSIDNLYLTTRTINFMMAKNGWYSTDKEATLAAIKWCELFYVLKSKKVE